MGMCSVGYRNYTEMFPFGKLYPFFVKLKVLLQEKPIIQPLKFNPFMSVRCAVLPALDVKQLVLSKETNGVMCFVSLTDGKVNIL